MGAPVAAIIIRKEKDLVAQFVAAGAISPSSAQSADTLRIDQGVALRLLRKRAVIRETDRGLLYLDEPSWTALGATRRRIAAIMLIVVCGLGMAAAFGIFGNS